MNEWYEQNQLVYFHDLTVDGIYIRYRYTTNEETKYFLVSREVTTTNHDSIFHLRLPERRTVAWKNCLAILLPPAHRTDIECDIRDDLMQMRQSGFSEISIRFYVVWQFFWAVFRLYGGRIMKLLGFTALMDKLGH